MMRQDGIRKPRFASLASVALLLLLKAVYDDDDVDEHYGLGMLLVAT